MSITMRNGKDIRLVFRLGDKGREVTTIALSWHEALDAEDYYRGIGATSISWEHWTPNGWRSMPTPDVHGTTTGAAGACVVTAQENGPHEHE